METSTSTKPTSRGRKLIAWLARNSIKIAVRLLILGFAIHLGWAFQSRTLPDLAPWHRVELEEEFRARDDRDGFEFGDYLELEERLFKELKTEIVDRFDATPGETRSSRYARGGRLNPLEFERNWNRSYELVPETTRGAAVLIHGLTDSPYSLRKVGELLHARGFHVVGLRLPGHGTIPAGLTRASWEDWLAATRIAVRHARKAADGRGPVWLVGYSTGAALSLLHALDALDDPDLAMPDRLVLFSAAVGVSPFAALAHLHVVLSGFRYFEKFAWLDVKPEYDPYKYQSFPKRAADQSHEISSALQDRLLEAAEVGRLGDMPPILTFQSAVDDTVLVDAVIDELYARLKNDESELVLFDIDRRDGVRDFMTGDPGLVRRLEVGGPLPYRLTVIRNEEKSPDVFEHVRPAGSVRADVKPLGLQWPQSVFSLSHVALPFSPADPLYGDASVDGALRGASFGNLQLRGERNLLVVSANDYMRLRYNPFFPYIERRIAQLLE